MAAIVAADVTARRIRISKWGPDGSHPSGKVPIEVLMGVTIDPGTTDTYPALGIPGTSLFSGSTPNTTPAVSDSGLDPTQLLIYPGPVMIRADETTPLTPVFFASMYNSAATAAGQLIKLWRPAGGMAASAATITAATLAIASGNLTDSGNGLVTAGFRAGDIVAISGFTGATTNNTWALVTVVAAGQLTLVNPASPFTNDAAGETVTVTALRSAGGIEEFPVTDITLADLFGGDAEPYFEIMLRGYLRENLRPTDFGIYGA